MDDLSKLLMNERKQIQAIEQLETKREKLVQTSFKDLAIGSGEKTVTVLLHYVEDKQQKEQLEQSVAKLIEVIVELKHKEQLNADLIKQSMEFVQLSLEMLQPSMKNINYNNKNLEKPMQNNNSVFDSRA